MAKISRSFQLFAKPVGAVCNMACRYCYYLEKTSLYPTKPIRMPEILLEEYIVQHIEASSEKVIRFSWHGGEPTLAGLDYFRLICDFQKKHLPADRRISNGIQTNGTLIDEEWARFFVEEAFIVGLSLDGPGDIHNRFRTDREGRPSFSRTIQGFEILKRYGVPVEILCVVNNFNVKSPLKIYHFFKDIGAGYISFLPCVERKENGSLQDYSVPSDRFGDFLCAIFDEWVEKDIGRIKIQIFEEAARTAFGQEHSLCIFRPVCGDIPVLEYNGDVYSCDHYVNPDHFLGNIIEIPLAKLLDTPFQRRFGQNKKNSLPEYCRTCKVLKMCNGGCPKNRFANTPDGEKGLNILCPAYLQFFNHIQPWVNVVSEEWRRQNP